MPQQAYGFLFALGIVGVMAANTINAHRPPRIGTDRLMRPGTMGAAASGLVGAFADGTPWPTGWVIALAGLASAASGWAPLRISSPDRNGEAS